MHPLEWIQQIAITVIVPMVLHRPCGGQPVPFDRTSMLKYRTIDGKATPFLVCDACGKLIDDVYLAGVVYRKPQQDAVAGVGDIFFAHKHGCLDAVELKLGPAFSGWEELHRYLSFVTHNVKLTPQDISDTLELSRETGI